MFSKNKINLKQYNQKKRIGSGSYGEVFIIEHKKTQAQYAAKISFKSFSQFNEDELKNHLREVEIISKADFPSIVKFIGYSRKDFENIDKPVIVTEFVPNGS